MSVTAIHLLDGPLEGHIRAVDIEANSTGQIAVRDVNDPDHVYWYRVQGDQAYFEATEYKPPDSGSALPESDGR
jgi:hypothetical protein